MPLVFRNGDWLLHRAILTHARLSPDRPALICRDVTLSWRELEERTSRFGNALIARGVGRGDRVAFLMQSGIDAFVALWGTIRAGAVAVAVNTMMGGDSLRTMIADSGATFLFTDDKHFETADGVVAQLNHISSDRLIVSGGGGGQETFAAFVDGGSPEPLDLDIGPDDSINIVYTSGSTGVPKGIEHSHLSRHNYTFGVGHYLGIDHHSVGLLATPVYTNGTWMIMAPCLFRGGTCVILPKFDAGEFLRLVEVHQCNYTFLVPTQILRVVAHPDIATRDTSSLKGLVSAGQALMPSLFDELLVKLPTAGVYENYGMSEGFATFIGPADYAIGKRGSVGKSMCMDDICIVGPDGSILPRGESGEICGYSVGLMKGYFNRPDLTEEAIWYSPDGRSFLRSGDLGTMDEDGYVYVSGRLKDMIKSGGINIWPADIEEVLSEHPAVFEAAVVGAPHPDWIETPVAFVILHQGQTIDGAELQVWLNGRLNKFQRVSQVCIVDDLPRVTYDKVDKKALRAPLWNQEKA